jgi:beta-galactosidase
MTCIILFFMLLLWTHQSCAVDRSFHIENNTFILNGTPLRLRSGSIHYSRVPKVYWKDRLKRLHAMGLNAVQTYVMWNYHETNKGEFDFQDDKDLSAFIQACQDEGLLVLLRLGPYSCGEWEFGGFPAWVIDHQPQVTLRTYETGYISLVDKWWSKLLPVVKPHLYSNGGSVVMVQVENEFGSFGDVSKNDNDLKYMKHLVQLVRQYLGNAIQIYTTDGGNTDYMSRGTLNGSIVYTVGDHGPSSDVSNCQAMREYNAPGLSPCMDSEYYTGWLTHWGDPSLANTSSSVVTQWLDNIMTNNGSFNLYMGHGGTSFDFWSGSNGGGQSFQPDITSYDYDSPVSEGGEHGYGSDGIDKYIAIQSIIAKHATILSKEPPLPPRIAFPTVTFRKSATLLENLDVLQPMKTMKKDDHTKTTTFPVLTKGLSPPSMEEIGQNYGFILYETTFPSSSNSSTNNPTIGFSTFPRDRAHVFVDSQLAISTPMYRPNYNQSVPILMNNGTSLQILLENMGRLNYGREMYDPKGIATNEYFLWNGKKLSSSTTTWKTYSLPLEYEQLQKIHWNIQPKNKINNHDDEPFTPTFYRTTMNITTIADTYIAPKGWYKGLIWVNGNNLGRYWESKGPQHGLYCPSSYWKNGVNEIILLELDGKSDTLELFFQITFER